LDELKVFKCVDPHIDIGRGDLSIWKAGSGKLQKLLAFFAFCTAMGISSNLANRRFIGRNWCAFAVDTPLHH
jgi:hypothetical protein